MLGRVAGQGVSGHRYRGGQCAVSVRGFVRRCVIRACGRIDVFNQLEWCTRPDSQCVKKKSRAIIQPRRHTHIHTFRYKGAQRYMHTHVLPALVIHHSYAHIYVCLLCVCARVCAVCVRVCICECLCACVCVSVSDARSSASSPWVRRE